MNKKNIIDIIMHSRGDARYHQCNQQFCPVCVNKIIKPGDVIFISNHAVNRDKSYFANPHSIDLNHKNTHFGYGFGGHFCLGAKLARIEMLMCFESLLERFPQIHMEPSIPAIRKHHSLSFSGFKELVLVH